MHRTLIPIVVAVSCSVPVAAQVRPFGAGCETHLSKLPSMRSTAPLIAQTSFGMDFDTVAPSAPFLLIFGISSTKWSGVPLPIDMTAFGFPGCFLNVSYDKVFGLVSGANSHLTLPVQPGTLPAGARLYAQIVVPEKNGSRLAASQGYELTMQKSVKPFNIAVLPDSQSYVLAASWTSHFNSMTQWIVSNRVAKNTVFVSHVGDIVFDGAVGSNKNKVQWDRAQSAMLRLDGDLSTNPNGLVPYSTAIGNRDYDVIFMKTAYSQYKSYFGPTRYTGRKWFKGIGPDGLNMYQIFEANGTEYMHVMLEWRPRDVAITWAQRILSANPELPTILTTHQYLSTGTLVYDNNGNTPNSGGDNGGLSIREKLVEPFPQVFLVLCGHNYNGAHRRSETILGQTVVEIMLDYSFDPNGGNGWMNLIECQPDKAKLVSTCLSPTYIPGITIGLDRSSTPNNNATYDLGFHLHRRVLETTETLRFTGGHDRGHGVYTGALDTFVNSSTAMTAYGSESNVTASDPVGTMEIQGLLKFGNIFGAGAGQIPAGKRVVQAVLTLTTEGVGATSKAVNNFFQLRVPFDEKSTWASLNGGIQVGTDTDPVPIATTSNLIATECTRSFDVTSSLRSWQNGKANHGWAIINSASDSWSFRSREWTSVVERPMLTVIYER